MSCGHSCQCQLSWPLDTLGFKRDPINSEKAWLDFAVRLLSREMVGKGKGQETVWNDKCKPEWWDGTVGLAWKNPTSNPKDTKEVLQKKYLALEKHLVDKGRFPKELEEEAKLWKAGNVKELYLQTTLTSLLGKVTSLHCAVDDACKKVKEINARVNTSLFNDITKCLNATLRATENFRCTEPVVAKRRAKDGKENNTSVPPKSRKIDSVQSTSSTSQENVTSQETFAKEPSEILAVAQKMMDKRRREKGHTVRNVKTIFPKPSPLPTNASVPLVSSVSLPVIHISAEQLNYVLTGTNNVKISPNLSNHPLLVGSLLNGATLNFLTTDKLDISDQNISCAHLTPIPAQADNLFVPRVLASCSVEPNSSNNSAPSCCTSTSPFSSDDEASFSSSTNSSVPVVSTLGPSFPILSPSTSDDSHCYSLPTAIDLLSSSPPSNDSSSIASGSHSSGPSSYDSSSFLYSSETSDSPHYDDYVDHSILSDLPTFDHMSPSCSSNNSLVSFDLKDQLVDQSGSDDLLDISLWEEDGSDMLEKFLQDLN